MKKVKVIYEVAGRRRSSQQDFLSTRCAGIVITNKLKEDVEGLEPTEHFRKFFTHCRLTHVATGRTVLPNDVVLTRVHARAVAAALSESGIDFLKEIPNWKNECFTDLKAWFVDLCKPKPPKFCPGWANTGGKL